MKNLLWVLMLALTACSADVRRFVPPGEDVAQMAHLIALSDPAETLSHWEAHYLFITSVDGQQSKSNWEVRKLPNDVYVAPGMHRFGVIYQHAGLTASAQFEIIKPAPTLMSCPRLGMAPMFVLSVQTMAWGDVQTLVSGGCSYARRAELRGP